MEILSILIASFVHVTIIQMFFSITFTLLKTPSSYYKMSILTYVHLISVMSGSKFCMQKPFMYDI